MALYVAPYVYQKATGYIHNALIFAPAPPSVAGSADGPKSETFSLRRRRTTQRKYMLEGGAGKCLLLHDGQMHLILVYCIWIIVLQSAWTEHQVRLRYP